jgi:hypothetical protein
LEKFEAKISKISAQTKQFFKTAGFSHKYSTFRHLRQSLMRPHHQLVTQKIEREPHNWLQIVDAAAPVD